MGHPVIYFTANIRSALRRGLPVYFEFGPAIGTQIHQQESGYQYTEKRASWASSQLPVEGKHLHVPGQ